MKNPDTGWVGSHGLIFILGMIFGAVPTAWIVDMGWREWEQSQDAVFRRMDQDITWGREWWMYAERLEADLIRLGAPNVYKEPDGRYKFRRTP